MSTNSSPATVAAAAAPKTAARREARHIALLLSAALVTGVALQVVFGPGPRAMVVTAVSSAFATLVATRAAAGRWRESLSSFRFAAVSTAALAFVAAVGTLVVQDKPSDYYLGRYGELGRVMLSLRLDDVFHSLWFAAIAGVFVAAVASSAAMRLPPRAKTFGFLVCHAGVLTTLAGGAVSSALTTRGRLDLHAGAESVTQVRIAAGPSAGQVANLGFELRLDRFDLVTYEPEFRVAYYEPSDETFRLRASFAPEVGTRHALPGGSSFRVKQLEGYAGGASQGAPDEQRSATGPAAVLEVAAAGGTHETPVLFAARPGSNYVRVPGGVLTFEKRPDEAKAFVSNVTITDGDDVRQARIAVNEPLSFGGWTFYQASHDPRDRTYSGIDAVRDPGLPWVFAGFALTATGVAWMFYAERFARRAALHHGGSGAGVAA